MNSTSTVSKKRFVIYLASLYMARMLLTMFIGSEPPFPIFPIGTVFISLVSILGIASYHYVKNKCLQKELFLIITICCVLLSVYCILEGVVLIIRGENLFYLRSFIDAFFIGMVWYGMKLKIFLQLIST